MASGGASSAGAVPPPLSKSHVDKTSFQYRAKRMIRKFGPFTLIVVLLFGIKYFLMAIHFNVHHIKSNILEQCEAQAEYGLRRIYSSSKNEHWTQHKMVGRGTYGFVQWSAYRISASQVVAVGFGASVLREHRRASTCAWHGDDGKSIPGEPKISYPEPKSDNFQYEPVILSCILSGRVSTDMGGYASMTLDKEHIVLYREKANAPGERDATAAHKYKASFCTFPVSENVDGERLREWLDVHKFMGANHVIAYDAGGMDKKVMDHLSQYVDTGFLEITPMRGISEYQLKSHGKVVAMHDCLYRSALTSNWVVYINWDDILRMQSPRFLSILLDDNKDLAWMSYGCRVFSTKLCLDTSAVPDSAKGFVGTAGGDVAFPQERMVYHWPHYLCSDDNRGDKEMCPGDLGMRYIIVNPHKVSLVDESEVLEPTEGGKVLSADDVRHDRFEGIHLEDASEKWCKEVHKPEDSVNWWQKSDEMQSTMAEARKEIKSKEPAT